MRSLILPLFSIGLLGLSIAELSVLPSLLHEKRYHVPTGWSHSRKHHALATLPLRFALSQPNINAIHQYINDVAHPDSPNYGNHWTAAQVAERFAPSHDTIQAVTAWLLDGGFAKERIRIITFRGWIELNTTVQEAEKLLKAEYHIYRHISGKEHVSCESYHLPAHVAPHVDFVMPTVHFDTIISRTPEPSHLTVRDSTSHTSTGTQGPCFDCPETTGVISEIFNQLDKCDQLITPFCLRALYGLEYKPHANNNSFAIAEFTPGAYVPSDLDDFGKVYAPDIVGKRPNLVSIDGGSIQANMTGFDYNGESNLDLQYGMALVTSAQDVILYQLGDDIQHASDNNLLNAFDGSYCNFAGGDDSNVDGIYPDGAPGGYKGAEDCGTVKPANVISISYYYNEADLTPAYTARQCAEFAKLGLMGVTVLFASGDNGVAGLNNICLDSDGSQSADGKHFSPSFPGTCPYVTSVGATQVNVNSTVYQPESACEQLISTGFLYSGGGFSNHFSIPDYQKDAVQSYLKTYPTPYSPTNYNSSGSRAHPDLSANGAKYAVSLQGNFTRVYGTSASTPVVGAILTLVNDARLFSGKKPIGFINPTIYSSSFADAFHDITNGTNPGCGTLGFNATKGWDPVTGLGTPNFPKLVEKWLALP